MIAYIFQSLELKKSFRETLPGEYCAVIPGVRKHKTIVTVVNLRSIYSLR